MCRRYANYSKALAGALFSVRSALASHEFSMASMRLCSIDNWAAGYAHAYISSLILVRFKAVSDASMSHLPCCEGSAFCLKS